MPDVFDAAMRSAVMRRVRRTNTAPEMIVRRTLHRMGFRFRLHRRDLPGRPDVVLPRYKTVIFVHGCFWHGHVGCRRAGRPTSHTAYWNWRLDRNIARDRQNVADLEQAGWSVLIVWECEVKNAVEAEKVLANLLPARPAVVQPANANGASSTA
jgi:DNA mismatch endonuclease (patch repair protein)